MNNALTTTNGNSTQLAQFGELSVQGVVDRKRKIGEVMKAVMREGEHFGKIPGCGDKPTLYKAGAEILATTFALAPTFDIKQTDLANGHREYQVICTLVHIPTSLEVGQGVGCCSTHESKYRWRRGDRKCPDCGKSGTIIKGKADYGGGWLCFNKKGGCGSKWPDGAKVIEDQQTDRVENPDPADQYNTVLKMAKKRAQVDATLTATGASDILTQDLEDLPAGSVDTRDAIDADFEDLPAVPPGESALAAIDMAGSVAELETLVPTLKKLKGDIYKTARAKYGERKRWLEQHAGAQ
jgi:hypothetical protein